MKVKQNKNIRKKSRKEEYRSSKNKKEPKHTKQKRSDLKSPPKGLRNPFSLTESDVGDGVGDSLRAGGAAAVEVPEASLKKQTRCIQI